MTIYSIEGILFGIKTGSRKVNKNLRGGVFYKHNVYELLMAEREGFEPSVEL